MPRMRIGLASVAAVALLALAGCGSSSSSSSSSAARRRHVERSSNVERCEHRHEQWPARARAASGGRPPTCPRAGPSRASKATGTPINIGTIDTHQPGTDFTDGPNMIQAYFNCVNDNGGVNGHPLKLFVELDQTQPAQITAAAHKLIQSDHVVAIDGVFDLLECTLDQAYWKQLGIYEMDAGIAPECWSTPNSAAVNMGPRYSSDGAVQYALDVGKRQEDRVRPVQRPGHRLHRRGPGGAREGRGRADHVADRERADQRRQLGRAQPGQLGRLQRLRWCSTSPRPRRW